MLVAAKAFGSLVFGTPQILDADSVGLLVVLAEDQTLEFPDLLTEYEVL